MTTNAKFVQICCGARQYNTQFYNSTELFALDERGSVWHYEFHNQVWVPLKRTRGEVLEIPSQKGGS